MEATIRFPSLTLSIILPVVPIAIALPMAPLVESVELLLACGYRTLPTSTSSGQVYMLFTTIIVPVSDLFFMDAQLTYFLSLQQTQRSRSLR